MLNIRGILSDWSTYDGYGDIRIRGLYAGTEVEERYDNGDVIVTSPIVRIYKENGVVFCQTKNSLYILV
jgi:hypothetical protein